MKRLETLLQGECTSHILPFLWMKGEDNDTIGRELDRIEECGIREVCLESRPHPDFCGPGWWENLDYVCDQAKKRGMRLWILDDNKFPTGHANGGYAKQPEKRKLYLAERHMDIHGPCRNGAVLAENFMGSDGKLLGILAAPKPDGESLAISGEGMIDLTSRYQNGFVYFDLPEGAYRLFILFTTRKGGGRDEYMNLIDSDSVRVLIDEVYEKHYARYGEYFGSTIAGFFSDEPELGNVPGYPFDDTLGKKDQRLPWSGELEAELRGKWGEDFLTSLPALWYDSGEKTVRIRSEYMDCMTGLVRKCFSGQVGEWCAEHGVEYIGHIIEDDNAHTRMGCSIGHYFREMEGQHMAGIDVVHHQIVPGFTEPVHQWIAGDRDGEFFHYGLAKLGSSAAHIQGNKKGRALCEIFGNYGWAEGNSFMKWLTNHMLVRGINEFTPHAFSMRYPDPDCPPHFYAGGNNPGFACFTWLMKYMNRSAHLLSGGVHLADAAILYHGESEWSGGETMFFQKPGRKLMEAQLDYDVIPADVFETKGRRDGGTERFCGSKDVSTAGQEGVSSADVLMPGGGADRVRTQDGSRMECCVQAAGCARADFAHVEDGWLCIRQERYSCLILPYAKYLDGRVVRFVEENAPKGLKVFVIDGLPEGDTLGNGLPENWESCVTVVPLGQVAGKVEELETAMGGRELTVVKADETVAGGCFPNLRSLVIRQPDGLAAMYFNESVSEKVCARVAVKNPDYGKVTVYDPWRNGADCYLLRGGYIPLSLEPGEAAFYCLETGDAACCPGTGQMLEHGPGTGEALEYGPETGEALDDCPEKSGAGGEMLACKETFPVLAGQRRLDVDWKVSKWEQPHVVQPPTVERRTAERKNTELQVTGQRSAEAQMETGEQSGPVFQEGAVLRAGEALPNLNGPDYWPDFVGIFRYETEFEQAKEKDRRYYLVLPEASDSVRVLLNGVDLGFLAGFPARVEITDALRDGENALALEVTNTLVWRIKDGASTHLQVPATGITEAPVVEWYK